MRENHAPARPRRQLALLRSGENQRFPGHCPRPQLFFRLNPQRIGIDEAQFLPEINLILEGGFGLVPVEIKYTQSVGTPDLRAIRDFIAERDCRLGIVVNNDEVARCYDEKLVGMPFACL